MALVKRTYVDGETIITAQNLNDIQDEVIAHESNKVPITRTVNSKALSSNITLTAADVSAVPTTRTVNSKALSSNITLTSDDIGYNSSTAYSSGTVGKAVTDINGASNYNNVHLIRNTKINSSLINSKIIAHCGFSTQYPSTDFAFTNAIDSGFKIIEGDFRITSDNKFVIWHDTAYNGLTIENTTLANLQAANTETSILTLEDFLKLVINSGCIAELDLTHYETGIYTSTHTQIYNIIKSINPLLDSVIFTGSFYILQQFILDDPSIIFCISGYTSASSIGDGTIEMCKNSRFPMISQAIGSVSNDIVSWCNSNGVSVKGYTATTYTQYYDALGNGCDYVICENVEPIKGFPFTLLSGTDLDQYIYDSRITINNANVGTDRVIVLDNKTVQIQFGFLIVKTLTSAQRSIIQLPTFLTPKYGTLVTVYGSTDQNAMYPIAQGDISLGRYINVGHYNRITVNSTYCQLQAQYKLANLL